MTEPLHGLAEVVYPFVGYLIPLPIIIPAVAAALAMLFARVPWVQRTLAFFALLASAGVAALLIVIADFYGIQAIQVGGWDAPVGITLVADRLSSIMLFTSSIVLFSVMWYAIAQGIRDGDRDSPVAVFLPTYMLLSMGINVSFLAGDLFNLYVGFEIFLVASYVLLTLGASPERVRAGVGYVMVSMTSSLVFVVGLALVYAAVGTMNMAQIGERMNDIPGGTQAAIFGVLLIAFGIKAAIVPLDAWLPDSYPTAPALVTAVFAGLLTKVGVYAIIRMRTSVFTDGTLDTLLMWVALATMVVGILGAMAQADIKRLLSFTLVSHIGYMIFGVSLGSAQGLSGAIFYAVHHILVQTALFLVVGLIERQAGTSSMRRLGSLMYTAPLVAVLYFIPAINLGGIPPFSGFLGKIILLQAAANDGSLLAWVLIVGAVATSLLTLYVMMVVWAKAFVRDRADAPDYHEPAQPADAPSRVPSGMIGATTLLVAASVAITVLAGPISGVTSRAAESAQDDSIYRYAVLGETSENPTRRLDQKERYAEGHENAERGADSLGERRAPLEDPAPGLSTAPATTASPTSATPVDEGSAEIETKEPR